VVYNCDVPHGHEHRGDRVNGTRANWEPGSTLLMGRYPLVCRVTETQTDGSYSLVEQTMPPRSLVMPHVHEAHDQLKIVLVGTVGFYVDGEEFTAGPGEFVLTPRRLPHAVWNAGDQDCAFGELTSPGGFETYFGEFAKLADSPDNNLASRSAMAAAYGVTFLPDIAAALITKHGLEL
jgi:quercetin dioxygenase-like cupin family protein